ncbi:hypothetical protein HK405_001910 [Cladochytrium tenue]|nr:hypothetical protein HK405_001910 [Cladochytrium tenue]
MQRLEHDGAAVAVGLIPGLVKVHFDSAAESVPSAVAAYATETTNSRESAYRRQKRLEPEVEEKVGANAKKVPPVDVDATDEGRPLAAGTGANGMAKGTVGDMAPGDGDRTREGDIGGNMDWEVSVGEAAALG